MKKRTIRLCALVLIMTLITSLSAPICTNAQQSVQNTPALYDGKTFVKTEDENGIHFYGVTGDVPVEESDIPKNIKTVSCKEDYYALNQNSNDKKSIASIGVSAPPAFVDNSTSKYFPQIGNQGQLGSCTFFAQIYYQFTYMMNRDMDITTTPENTFSPQWAYNVVAGTDNLIGPYYDCFSFMQKQGNVFLSQVPYTLDTTSYSPSEEIWRTSINYRIKDFYKIDNVGTKDKMITSADDEDLIPIKTALANGEVLTYSTHINSWKNVELKTNPQAPENDKYIGEYAVVAEIGSEGGHRMTIVGYNDNLWVDINENNRVDQGEMGALKVANSWGDEYANKGFIWIAYDALNETSCVEGTNFPANRNEIMGEIAGINVLKHKTDSTLYLKYTLNTADRTQVRLTLVAEKDGTIYSRNAYSNEYSGEKIAYDGSNTATDATMIQLLSSVVPQITSENLSDYSFSLILKDETDDDKPLTVKNCEIVDESTNRIYKPQNVYPFTLNGSEKTIEFTQSSLNHAVVYYRGYDAPTINYKVGNSDFMSANGVALEANTERRGYTHKYVIDLKSNDSATLYFTDGNDKIDNNNGKYFTATKGLNYFVTENVGKPFVMNFHKNFEGEIDVDECATFDVEASGGYDPYLYSYTVTQLETGEEVTENFDTRSYLNYYFRKAGDYKITVKVKDFSDTVYSDSMVVTIKDLPFEFDTMYTNKKTHLVGDEMTITAVTKHEKIKYTGRPENLYQFTVKDENGNVCFTNEKSANQYNLNVRFCTVIQPYTPKEAGNYTVTVSSTDANNQYAEMTTQFVVKDKHFGDSNSDGDVNIMDATTIQYYLANVFTDEDVNLETADCDSTNDVNIMDATYIQLYLAKKDNCGNTGKIIQYIPPTEPVTEKPTDTPTEKPTDPPATKNTVTFTNSLKWSGTIYCYYWSDENTAMTSWPGAQMTNSGTNDFGETLYTFDVPDNTKYIIFNNSSVQTVDISYPGGEIRYYPLNTKTGNGYNVETW